MLRHSFVGLLLIGLFVGGPIALSAQNGGISAQIQSLKAQIAELQRQLAELESIQSPCTLSNTTMTVGFSGENALCLQRFLNNAGFVVATSGPGSPGNETSYFGNLTRSALLRWQAAENIPATGLWDAASHNTSQNTPASQSLPNTSGDTPTSQSVPTPHSQSSAESTQTPLTITSFSPQEVSHGRTVTITGTGFTDDMTIIARFGPLEQRVEGASSPDGRTLTFNFLSPVASASSDVASNVAALPEEIKEDLLSQLAGFGHTLDVFDVDVAPTHEIIDAYTLIVARDNESVVADTTLNHVR